LEEDFSKDYGSHLRAVHLALVVICVSGIIISAAPGRQEISPGRQQLDEIRELVDDWNPRFLEAAKNTNEPGDLGNVQT
jgi:hypothetical protein